MDTSEDYIVSDGTVKHGGGKTISSPQSIAEKLQNIYEK